MGSHQGLEDTLKQAVGQDAIPGPGQPNVPGGLETPNWTRYEESLRYGVGARLQYGQTYPAWSDALEKTLAQEWRDGRQRVKHDWVQVKTAVRKGYEAVAAQKLL